MRVSQLNYGMHDIYACNLNSVKKLSSKSLNPDPSVSLDKSSKQ